MIIRFVKSSRNVGTYQNGANFSMQNDISAQDLYLNGDLTVLNYTYIWRWRDGSIKNYAASMVGELSHEEAVPVNRNQIFKKFNDFDNMGSLLEVNRKDLCRLFQNRPQEKHQKMVNDCERNIDPSRISRRNYGQDKKNSCFGFVNVANHKFWLVSHNGKRTCSSGDFRRQAIKQVNGGDISYLGI